MISMKLPDDIEDKLKVEANEREMSVSALVRWIIKEYLKKNNR